MVSSLGLTLSSRRRHRLLAGVAFFGLAVMFLFTEEHGAMTTSISRLLSTTRPKINQRVRKKLIKAIANNLDESVYRFMPSSFNSVSSNNAPDREASMMLFAHVPKSGGSNVKAYYKCLLQSKEMFPPRKGEPLLKGTTKESAKTTLVLGKLGQAPYYFGNSHELPKAKAFTMLRHPVERMVSDYYYIQNADWEAGYDPDLANKMSLVEFGTMEHRNVLTRVLLYNQTMTKGDDDDGRLQLAKELLREYYLVGLTDQTTESLRRFDAYFGIDVEMLKEIETKERYATCKNRFWEKNSGDDTEEQQEQEWELKSNSNEHPHLDPHGDEWRAIADANRHDIELYEYAEKLFREQGRFFDNASKEIFIDTETKNVKAE